MAAAAPPHSASDWEMKGTSRMETGAGWASRGAASATIKTNVRKLSVHRNDDQDEHQQRDDNHRRRNDNLRLSAGHGVVNLPGLRGDAGELLALQRRHR